MHPNPIFRQEPQDQNSALAAQIGFGMLCTVHEGAPLLAHVPFVLDESGAFAELHLARGNAIVRTKAPSLPATLAVQGPHGYVSPDWYGVEEQVPTWNYVAVHIKGRLVPLPQDEIRRVVDEISSEYEGRLAGKTPWTSAKMTPDVLEKMLIQIVPFRFEIEAMDGTWKLNQNKTPQVRASAAEHMDRSAVGSDTAALAALMRAVKVG